MPSTTPSPSPRPPPPPLPPSLHRPRRHPLHRPRRRLLHLPAPGVSPTYDVCRYPSVCRHPLVRHVPAARHRAERRPGDRRASSASVPPGWVCRGPDVCTRRQAAVCQCDPYSACSTRVPHKLFHYFHNTQHSTHKNVKSHMSRVPRFGSRLPGCSVLETCRTHSESSLAFLISVKHYGVSTVALGNAICHRRNTARNALGKLSKSRSGHAARPRLVRTFPPPPPRGRSPRPTHASPRPRWSGGAASGRSEQPCSRPGRAPSWRTP